MILDDTMQNSPRLSDAIRGALSGLDAFKILKDVFQEALPVNKKSTAHLYEFDQNRTLAQRKKDNKEAEAILKKVKEQGYQVTEADKAVLAKYSGKGGAITGADGKKGSQYEYYTPAPIAEGMWSLLSELGFSGGKVLDPCGGTGIFGATSPTNAVIDAVELNETSGMVQKLVNDNEFYSTTVSPFEQVAANNPDELYDAIVTNVPFGDTTARGANFQHDHKKAIDELVGMLNAGRSKFQAAMAKQKVKLPSEATTAKPKQVEVLTATRDKLKEDIATIREEAAKLGEGDSAGK